MSDDVRRLSALLQNPREDLDIEIKSWLDLVDDRGHKALLAKSLIALANHGGGFVLIGLDLNETGTYSEAKGRPANLNGYNQDIINGIVSYFAEPGFHCRLDIVEHPDTGSPFPIISIPAGAVPIRSKRNGPDGQGIAQSQYYMRRPGPSSEPPQNGHEWDKLIGRCVREHRADLLDSIRRIVTGEIVAPSISSQEDTWAALDTWIEESLERWEQKRSELPPKSSARCPLGYWWAAYQIVGITAPVTAGALKEIMAHDRVRHTGWPPWPTRGGTGIPLVPQGDGIECWLGAKDPNERRASEADYWRATPNGLFFQLRGYQEDSSEMKPDQPGEVFGLVLPIWRLAECLLHAHDMANQLTDGEANILFRIGWTGLRGRWLHPPSRLSFEFDKLEWSAEEDSFVLEALLESSKIRDNLTEIVWQMLKPLYEKFQFFELPIELVQHELNSMLAHRF